MEWLHLAKADLPCTAQPPQATLRSHHTPTTPPDPGTPRDGSNAHSRTPQPALSHLMLAAHVARTVPGQLHHPFPYGSWMMPHCQRPTPYPRPQCRGDHSIPPALSTAPQKVITPTSCKETCLACPSFLVAFTGTSQHHPRAAFQHPRGAGGRLPSPPTPELAGSVGRGRHWSPWVVCYGSQLPLSLERFRRRVTHELECAKPPANRASCPRPRRGVVRGEQPAPRHSTAQHSTALTQLHGPHVLLKWATTWLR